MLPGHFRKVASKMPVIWNYLSVMTCDPTARADGDNDGLRIPVVGARDPDVVVDRRTVSKYPIQGDELSVSNGDGSPLNPTSSLQSLISELKCGILFRCPCPSGLSHRGFEPAGFPFRQST